ncbi:Metallo-dependent phosphatase [Meredithblackwellia eburnea MCA 4105]
MASDALSKASLNTTSDSKRRTFEGPVSGETKEADSSKDKGAEQPCAPPPPRHGRILNFLAKHGFRIAFNLFCFLLAYTVYPKLKGWSNSPPTLIFKENGSFKIVVFSDLHFGERNGDGTWAEWGVKQDTNSVRVMNHNLDDETPDFVVFNGDQVTGENLLQHNATSYLDLALTPTTSRNIPFATIYGNHDNAPHISHSSLYSHEKQNYRHLSLTGENRESSRDWNSRFNWVLPVFARGSTSEGDGVGRKPELLIWGFDSRGGIWEDPGMYKDWVDEKIAEWIRSTTHRLRRQYRSRLPPSIAFVHLTPYPVNQIQSSIVTPNPDYPGLNDDVPSDYQGTNHREIVRPDEAFWRALTVELGREGEGGLVALVVGHNHGNNWCAKSEEVPHTICFARHTGYGGYGSRERGSRVFEFAKGEAREGGGGLGVKTWMRMEDHEVANMTVLR